MNQSYQHKKGPPKMIKDLKHGNTAHLRQSLLDITQIENLNKIFIGRKTHYKINHTDIKNQSLMKKKQHNNTTTITTIDNQEQLQQTNKNHNNNNNQQQHLYTLSPQENLQLIKRQRITNKMKDKLQQMFKPQQARKYKLRKPVLHNLLQDFKSSFRVEEQLKFKQALKDSEKNLQHIKINSKKRISSQYIRSESTCGRKKFISISTGMPVGKHSVLPTFEQFVKGKYKVKQKPFAGIDIMKIDNYFNSMMITQPNIENRSKRTSSFKDDFIKHFNRQVTSKNSINHGSNNSNHRIMNRSKTNSPITNYYTTTNDQQLSQIQSANFIDNDKDLLKLIHPNRTLRSKSAINPQHNFKKSQQSSKKIITAMQTYYSVKKQKNQQCDSMVQYIKKDRPLTSHLRRKNYKIIGKSHIDHVDKYRQKSQEERMKILQRNYDFYISLLKIFEHCKKEEISTSLMILNRLKEFFESQYVLFELDVERICTVMKGDKIDFGVKIIYENLVEYAKKDQNLSTQNSQQFQML